MSCDTYSESGSGGSGSGPRPSSAKARERQARGRQFLPVRSSPLTSWTPWRRSRRVVSGDHWDAAQDVGQFNAAREAERTDWDALAEPAEGIEAVFDVIREDRR